MFSVLAERYILMYLITEHASCVKTLIYLPFVGLSIPKGRGYTHAYLYQEEDPTGPLRSHKQTVNHAKQALSSGSPVRTNGIV